jgi:DNA modification methylase
MRPGAFHFVITSPPYFQLVDYGHAEQLGLEMSIATYLNQMVRVFAEILRILPEGGVCLIVIQDTINNCSPIRALGQRRVDRGWSSRRELQDGYFEKEPLDIPRLLRNALRRSGWKHRNYLIWDKGSSGQVPNSDTAPTGHEYILQMVKWTPNGRMYGNCKALKHSVLRHAPVHDDYHICPFPPKLVRELLSMCPQTVVVDGETVPAIVFDPFSGIGTTCIEAMQVCNFQTGGRRRAIGIDLNCNRAIELIQPQRQQFSIWDALEPCQSATPV